MIIESIYVWVALKLQATVLEELPFLLLCAVRHGVLRIFSKLGWTVINNGASWYGLSVVEWSL